MPSPVVTRKRPKVIGTVLLAPIGNAACHGATLMQALENGVSQLVFYGLGATDTAQKACLCRKMRLWCTFHQTIATILDYPSGYEIPSMLAMKYPKVRAMRTAQGELFHFFNHIHWDATKANLFEWHNLRSIHLYKNRFFTAAESRRFKVFTNIEKIVIEADPYKPHEANPDTDIPNTHMCHVTKKVFHVHEIMAIHWADDLVFLQALAKANRLRHIDVKGMTRLINHLDKFANEVNRIWPCLEVLSPLPRQGVSQIAIISNMSNIAPATITNVSPITIDLCTSNLRAKLTSLSICIPRSERTMLNNLPYIDIGHAIGQCPNLVTLTISEYVNIYNVTMLDRLHAAEKPEIRFTSTPWGQHNCLRDITVDKSGRLNLEDLGALMRRCPNMRRISVALTNDYMFARRPGLPNMAETEILCTLSANDVLSVDSKLRLRVPYALRRAYWGKAAALFFKGDE